MIHLHYISILWFQGSFPEPSGFITSYVVPIAGFCIVVFCFVASARLSSPLKFEGFGIHLEITILSLLFLLGAAMMLAGYVVHVLDLNTKEKKAEEKAQQEELICRYKLASSTNPEDTQVTLGQQDTVEIVIHDFSRNDVIQDLIITPSDPSSVSGRVLAVHAVYPFLPKYPLSVEKFSFGVQ